MKYSWLVLTAVSACLPAFPAPAAIVVGFVGGMVNPNNSTHTEVQLAMRLRRDYDSAVRVLMFANRQGEQARQQVLRLLDPRPSARRKARIVIFGHSWGASETVTLARSLGTLGIPVLLTVQVDSVRKHGENDGTIPANVVEAVNFYQQDGLLHGRKEIRAADPSRTQILGNFRSDYRDHTIDCQGYPWYARMFMKPHIEIESDPGVWRRVEDLIRSLLPPSAVTQRTRAE